MKAKCMAAMWPVSGVPYHRALAGFDIERFRPELVCIEAGKKFPERNAAVAAYFKEHGYRRLFRYAAYDGLNWYFTPRDPE